MINPVGTLISELRTAGIASQRIRGGESDPGDAKDQAEGYQRYVVLVHLGYAREHRAPIAEHRIGVRAYGATFQDAAVLFGQISDQLDNAGPRLSASGVAIYQSLDETGGSASKDPDTGQPFESGVLSVFCGTETVSGS